jgi:hypothetical protein
MDYQYIDYNYCKIVIDDNFVITNIQTRGIPEKGCGCYFKSLEITTAAVSENNPNDYASSGTVHLIDYRDDTFERLIDKLKRFTQSGGSDPTLQPTIEITIKCFTGKKVWTGYIMQWQFNFVGSSPEISLEWKSFQNTTGAGNFERKEYEDPIELLKSIRDDANFGVRYDIVDQSGRTLEDLAGTIRFIEDRFHFNSLNTTSGNKQLDYYKYVLQHCITSDSKLLSGRFDDQDKKFHIVYTDANNNIVTTEDGKTVSNLVFVQNGTDHSQRGSLFKYYQPRKSDGKIVIPMTSFSYNTNVPNVAMQSRVVDNPNGNQAQSTQGNSQTVNYTPDVPADKIDEKKALDSSNSAISISFECYNVLTFSLHNRTEPIYYDIYNERGDKSIISGRGIATQCTYSLSEGGVVSANVTITEQFNHAITETISSGDTLSKAVYNGLTVRQLIADKKASEEYLTKEDKVYIPLSWDRVPADDSEIINRFIDTCYLADAVDYSFIQELIYKGYYCLFALIVARAKLGINNIPPEIKDKDPVFNTSGGTQWGPSKNYYKVTDCSDANGGFWLAHFDGRPLRAVYERIGFSKKEYENHQHFDNLLTISNNEPISWQKFVFYSYVEDAALVKDNKDNHIVYTTVTVERYKPLFPDVVIIRNFDNGLKQDQQWLDWAFNLAYTGKNPVTNKYYFHNRLLTIWNDLWIEARKNIKCDNVSADHALCIQDMIRIYCANNYSASLLKDIRGKNVADQFKYLNEDSSIDSRLNSFAYCERACAILEYEYSLHPQEMAQHIWPLSTKENK